MNSPGRPVWREPMVWLMVGLPAACLVAIALTLQTAIDPDAASTSRDRVSRTAQVQTTDLSADRRAAALGLSAHLSRDAGSLHVQLQLPAPLPTRLRLLATHPTRAAQDVEIWMHQDAADTWRAAAPSARSDDAWLDDHTSWSLSLAPEDAAWRLDGVLGAGAYGTTLTPRFERE